jgi:hypothetical protein
MFYVKDMSTKPKKRKNDKSDNESKHHIVLSVKQNILGIKDKSKHQDNNDEILPFTVNNDPNILLHGYDMIITKGHLPRKSSLLDLLVDDV